MSDAPHTDATAMAAALARACGGRWSLRAHGGGSGFARLWCADGDGPLRCFVKSAPRIDAPMLAAEADGLRAIEATGSIRVPRVLTCVDDDRSGIALLALEGPDFAAPDAGFGLRFGQALAALHRAPLADARFGWPADNWLGATPQRNRQSADWPAFFASERLGALRDRLRAAGRLDGALDEALNCVIERALPRAFDDGHVPRPSLIHGDLWSGNWAMLADGMPVIFDPAVSQSDAEAELAMMELFGAPPTGFFAAYAQAGGLHAGYVRRRSLYQLYHLLNHALLFGGGYGRQALAVARSINALR